MGKGQTICIRGTSCRLLLLVIATWNESSFALQTVGPKRVSRQLGRQRIYSTPPTTPTIAPVDDFTATKKLSTAINLSSAVTKKAVWDDDNDNDNNNDNYNELDKNDMSIFDIVAGRAATCLVESDLRRDAKEEYSNIVSSSATNWINDATAFALQKAFDRVKLKVGGVTKAESLLIPHESSYILPCALPLLRHISLLMHSSFVFNILFVVGVTTIIIVVLLSLSLSLV